MNYLYEVPTSRRNIEFLPHYNPELSILKTGKWPKLKSGDSLYLECFFDFTKVHSDLNLDRQVRAIVRERSFVDCDFDGFLNRRQIVTFLGCKFFRCDFRNCDLDRVVFKNCEFYSTSFSMCNMNGSEFRNSKWFDTGVSKEETKLNDCYITNPNEFLRSIYLNPQFEKKVVGKSYDVDKFYALQATVARAILFSLSKHGSEGEFYEAVAVHENHQAKSRIYRRSYKKQWIGTFFLGAQFILIIAFGKINSWGKSPLMPLLFMLSSFLVFSFLYFLSAYKGLTEFTVLNSLEKSFNISILAGYTLESQSISEDWLRALQALQLVVSILLYSSFFATIIGRLSRVK